MKRTNWILGLLFLATMPISQALASEAEKPSKAQVTHGFRIGYTYGHNLDRNTNFDIRSSHMSTMGYEITEAIDSGLDGFRIVFVQNLVVSGLEQGLALPSLSALVGYELFGIAQMGVGGNFGVTGARMIIAAGFNPQAGNFQVPVHMHFIPDPSGDWRIGLSTGVNF